MQQCPTHGGHPAKYRCEKFEVEMCELCMKCRSPKLHCKHREHCVIWRLVEEDLAKEETPVEK